MLTFSPQYKSKRRWKEGNPILLLHRKLMTSLNYPLWIQQQLSVIGEIKTLINAENDTHLKGLKNPKHKQHKLSQQIGE